MQRRAEVFAVILLIFCVVAAPIAAPAYSVLSHEQIVDLTWEQQLKPLLLARFPDTLAYD